MWLMTTRGFFSVVAHNADPDRVLIRARCRGDIDAVAGPLGREPVLLHDADYAWRVEASRAEWSALLQEFAAEITYPNFKSAVHDPAHHDAYLRVWSVMHDALDDRADHAS